MADADNDNRRAQPGRKGVRVRRTDPAPHGGGLFGNRQPHAARDAVRAAQAPPASAAVVWKLHDFVVLEELYRATTGFVHHVRHRSDGREYVLKARTDAELGRHKDIMHEVKLLTRLRHPHIIRCYGHFWNESRSTLYIVLEYADRGDLYHSLVRRRKRLQYFSEETVWDMFRQVCEGLEYLHRHHVVHRDIKTLNILRVTNPDGSLSVKIADLGVGREVSAQTQMLQTFYGTPLYASPELVDNRPYNEKTDVWSLGVVLYELAALYPPFKGQSLVALAKAIDKGAYDPLPPHYSGGLSRLVRVLLDKDHARRPSVATILSWLAERPKGMTRQEINAHRRAGAAAAAGPAPLSGDAAGRDSEGKRAGGGGGGGGSGGGRRGNSKEDDADGSAGAAKDAPPGSPPSRSEQRGAASPVRSPPAEKPAGGPVRIRVRSKQRTRDLAKQRERDDKQRQDERQEKQQHKPSRSDRHAVADSSAAHVGARGDREHKRDAPKRAPRQPQPQHAKPPRPASRAAAGGEAAAASCPSDRLPVGASAVGDSGTDSSDGDSHGARRRQRGARPASGGTRASTSERAGGGGVVARGGGGGTNGGRRPSSALSEATAMSTPLSSRQRQRLENELRRRRVHQERLHQALAMFGADHGQAEQGRSPSAGGAADVSSFHWTGSMASTPASADGRGGAIASGRTAGSARSSVDHHRMQLRQVAREINDIEALLSGRPSTAGPTPRARQADASPSGALGPATSPPAVSPPGWGKGRDARGSGGGSGSHNARQRPKKHDLWGDRDGRAAASAASEVARSSTARDERLALRRRQRRERHARRNRTGHSGSSMPPRRLDSDDSDDGSDDGGHSDGSGSHKADRSSDRRPRRSPSSIGGGGATARTRESAAAHSRHAHRRTHASATSTGSRRFNLLAGTWQDSAS